MIQPSLNKEKKNLIFFSLSLILILTGSIAVFLLQKDSELEILPLLLEAKHHPKPQRTPGTFAEEFGDSASKAELIYNNDTTFTFKYEKSIKQRHTFAGVWFPTENLNINFSKYDIIELDILALKARRIPFNLSVQNKLATHQYITNVIEIQKDKSTYEFYLKDFQTPSTWYGENNIAQIDIPEPDLSKIEALSFESCDLLGKGIDDEFTINKIVLKKDLQGIYTFIAGIVLFIILCVRLFLFHFGITEKIIHVPIKHVEYEKPINNDNDVITYLAENYTNPNLTLTDLSKKFGSNSQDLSAIIREKTQLTFPRYLSFLRIEEAKRILKSKQFSSISEVGYMVGFNSPSNFNRVFKTETGVSPSQYAETY